MNLDERLDKVVDELWKISETYPVYYERAKEAIKQLINEVRIEELRRVDWYIKELEKIEG